VIPALAQRVAAAEQRDNEHAGSIDAHRLKAGS
jgi:hypothetical protein